MKKRLVVSMLAVVCALSLVACGGKKDDSSDKAAVINEGDPIKFITPGSSSEYGIVSNAAIMLLEKAGYETSLSGQITGLDMLREAMLSDEFDVVMGYTGNGMYYMDEPCSDIWTDWQKGYERIRDFDAENGVTWLEPAPANNTELLAVTKEFAEENNIKDMYDFAKYVNDGGELKLATPQYWVEYEQGLPGFERVYGFEVRDDQLVIGSKAEKEVSEGIDGLNCTMVFTTDGLIDEYDLYVIEDPENVPPFFAPCLTIKTEKLDKYPEIADILNPMMKELTSEKLIELNSKVTSEGANAKDVAEEYLKSIGLL